MYNLSHHRLSLPSLHPIPHSPKDSMGHEGMSHQAWCPPMQLPVPAIHPIPQEDTVGHQGMSHGVLPHKSLVQPVYPIPKRCVECQGLSHVVPSTTLCHICRFDPLVPKGMYGRSWDVAWSSLTQLSVPVFYLQSLFVQ